MFRRNGVTPFMSRLMVLIGSDDPIDISRATGIKYNTVRNYVANRRIPNPAQLVEIANNTGFSLDYLLLGEGKPYLPGRRAGAGEKIQRKYIEVEEAESGSEIPPKIEVVLAPITLEVRLVGVSSDSPVQIAQVEIKKAQAQGERINGGDAKCE